MSARAVTAFNLRILLVGAALLLAWGVGLPAFMLLDPLALPASQVSGGVAAVAAVIATLVAAHVRSRPTGAPSPGRTAIDLAMATAISAIAVWGWGRAEQRIPYLELFTLLCLRVATGCAASVVLFVSGRALLRRHRVAAAPGQLPGIRTVYATSAGALGLLAAVVLGIGLAGRAAGARDRQLVQQLRSFADLGAAALAHAATDAEREALLRALEVSAKVAVELLPPGDRPAVLERATLQADAGADHVIAVADDVRLHVISAASPYGVLWIVAGANVRPDVRAPDDAPGLIMLALLVLGAPLAAGLVGHDLSTQLRRVTGALSALAHAPDAAGVPIASNDEVGDLAAELNAACRHFEAENRRLAADLDAAAAEDRARSRFLAAASHELRIPLNSIIGFCHVLRERGGLNEAQAEDVALIESAGDQLLRRVDDILDLSRIEAGEEQPLAPTAVNLAHLAEGVLAARGEDAAPGVAVGLDAAPGTPPALADPSRIRQVLENLVGNALKFTREGFVQVNIGTHPEGVHVQVADSGPGIPEEEFEAIFTEFHRVESQRQVAGTGLGLAIARRIVEQHGGRIWVESTPGQGSTFHVVLPAAEPQT